MLQRADTDRYCANCGRGFAAVRDDKQYCSNSCKQKAARKRRHNGMRHSLVGGLPDPVLEQLLDALVYYRCLSDGETTDQARVDAELGDLARRLLMWWSQRWRTLDLMGLNP
jgi:predicted nucleic acid-binding Zn ribbon protein